MAIPLSVKTALASVDELRFLLERVDINDPEQRAWLVWQAEIAQHWAALIPDETPAFPDLADGLAAFARTVADQAATR